MNKLYYYPSASKYGAKTILHHFYSSAYMDKNNLSFFVTSDETLLTTENIHVFHINMNGVRFIRRLFLDLFYVRYIIYKHKIDKIYNLQNIIIPFTKVEQTIYFHQALVFIEINFNILKNPKLWFYKHVYSRLVFYSMKKATKVIVQTNHIKSLILKKVGVNVNVSVETPKLTITNKLKKSDFVIITKLNLFYPTSPAIYKNYISLFRALLDLPVRLHSKINFIITINENYSREVLNFKKRMDYLGISNQFIGRIDQIDVLSILNESVLVYPSLIESLGLPILEAKILDRYIIAINEDYTHELLDDYKKVMFFDHNNSNQTDLRNKILYAIENIKC